MRGTLFLLLALSLLPTVSAYSPSGRCHARQDPDSRFRLPSHPVDRTTHPRITCVFGDPSVRRRRRVHPRIRTEGHHFLRWPELRRRTSLSTRPPTPLYSL